MPNGAATAHLLQPKLFAALREGYDAATLRRDTIAAVTVAIVALPLSMAIAVAKSDGARLYCLGASVQTMTDRDGVSLFGYVHAAKLLLREAGDILIVGGAGGSLATMLARRGKRVTIVVAARCARRGRPKCALI